MIYTMTVEDEKGNKADVEFHLDDATQLNDLGTAADFVSAVRVAMNSLAAKSFGDKLRRKDDFIEEGGLPRR